MILEVNDKIYTGGTLQEGAQYLEVMSVHFSKFYK